MHVDDIEYILLFIANEEYYQLLMTNESHPSGLDVASYTIEEVKNITSEYIMKNAVSMWILDHILYLCS